MISRLVYMFKRDRIFYIILFSIFVIQTLPGNVINKLPQGLYEGLFVAIIFNKLLDNRGEKTNAFLRFGVTRKEIYILTIIYDIINSVLISIAVTLRRMKIDNMDKDYFIYVFLLYFLCILVLFSYLSFHQVFKHTDYEPITWITWIIFIATYSGIYFEAFSTDNFTNFSEKLVSYKIFTLKQFYIMFLITIAFNYITSYLVHKGIEIRIKGETE